MNLPAVHIAAITLVCYLVTRVDSRPSEHLILRNGTVSPPEGMYVHYINQGA